MTIQRPSADDLIQTRLAATRHLAQSPEGSISPEGFAWSQSYRQDVTALLARLSAAEQALAEVERAADPTHGSASRLTPDGMARRLDAIVRIAGAALAGREETG